jgi:hypothetical protein
LCCVKHLYIVVLVLVLVVDVSRQLVFEDYDEHDTQAPVADLRRFRQTSSLGSCEDWCIGRVAFGAPLDCEISSVKRI